MTNQNLYPFATKARIKERITLDDEFAVACVAILNSRQTEDEQEIRETRYKNRRGWASSHAVRGGKLADKISSGEELSSEDLTLARTLVSSYTKQLAAHFRAEALESNPELADQAKVFGV